MTTPLDLDRLGQRLHALDDAAALLVRHGVDLGDHDPRTWIAHARARLRHGTAATVVALVGPTGSGKSSVLNRLAGATVARVGITRPTTSVTQAVTFDTPADAVLDLIGVARRHHLDAVEAGLGGLVLLDLPDFDSISADHRLEVDRLIGLVDLLVWVVDPQKYADASLHTGYLRDLATHGDVMQVVLNKTDTLTDEQRQACLDDLTRRLAEDGLPDLRPIPATTTTAAGIDPLRDVLSAEVEARHAAMTRIAADLRSRVADLTRLAGRRDPLDLDAVRRVLVDGFARAVGVEDVTALTAEQHRRDAALVTGWPPLRWVRRLRRPPLERLMTVSQRRGEHPVAAPEVNRALRAAGRLVSTQAEGGWATAAVQVVRARHDHVVTALDTAVLRRIAVLRRPARWWRPVAMLQTLLLAVAGIGGLWLAGIALARAVLLIDADALVVRIDGVPLPTAALVGGLVAGLVVAATARTVARLGARARARAARDRLRAGVTEVAEAEVIDPLETVLADADQVTELLSDAAGAPS